MKKTFFEIDYDQCSHLAMTLFMESAGINREGPKFERMRKDAFYMLSCIENRIELCGEYIFYDRDEMEFSGDRLSAGGQEFGCKAFEQLNKNSLIGMYLYACSAGDYSLPDENVLNQVYADLWGTAFTDAVRILIRKELEKDAKLSDSFGPGFYGMSTKAITRMKALLDFDQLGIEVKESNIMVPLKSCAGLYFAVNDDYQHINSQCASCFGNLKSCKLCQVSTLNHGGIPSA